MTEFAWSYDEFEQNSLIKSLLEVLGDREKCPQLASVQLVETLEGGKRRNKLRSRFAGKGIKLVLSDRQVNESAEENSSEDEDEEDSD